MESDDQHAQWVREFEAAARRPLELRMRYAFIWTYKPVLDDAPFRSFERSTVSGARRTCRRGWAMDRPRAKIPEVEP